MLGALFPKHFVYNWKRYPKESCSDCVLNLSFSLYVGVKLKVVGYIGEWITFEQAQITTLGVDPKYQGQGIATSLLEHAILFANQKQCEIMSLEVRVSNYVALNLYKKLGFEIVNIRKGYYQDNHEDAYLMIKPLGGNL